MKTAATTAASIHGLKLLFPLLGLGRGLSASFAAKSASIVHAAKVSSPLAVDM